MRELFQKSMLRRMKLLEQLSQANGWLSSSKLSKELHCSVKTVFNDAQYLEDRWGDQLAIKTSRKDGIRLISSKESSVSLIYAEVVQEVEAFSMIEALFFHPYEETDFWQRKFYFSKSTLYRMFNEIEGAFKRRELSFNRKECYVFGEDEKKVRFFYSNFFWEIYGLHNWPFAFDQQQMIQLAQKMNQTFSLRMNASQLMQFTYLLAVTFIRYGQGFYLSDEQEVSFDRYQEKLKGMQEDFSEILSSQKYTLSTGWEVDFSQCFFFYYYAWDSANEQKKITQRTYSFVLTLQKVMGISINQKDIVELTHMLTFIYTKWKIYPFPDAILFDRFHYISLSVQQNYVAFSAVTKKALSMMEKESSFPWYTQFFDEILYWLMVKWEKLPELLDHLRPQISLVILSDLGQEHASFVKLHIDKRFSTQVQTIVSDVPFFELDQQEEAFFKKYDLYVSNFHHERFLKDRLVIIDDMPTLKNLGSLTQMIDQKRLVPAEDFPFVQTGQVE